MDKFEKYDSLFAVLIPANNAARDAFSQVAQKKLDNKSWNPVARRNIKAGKQPVQVSNYTDASESDGGTGPPKTLRPILQGCYILDLSKPPRQPDKGWLIGGGKFSNGSDEHPDILLTERKRQTGVSSKHARLAHNYASGALIITASDIHGIWVNGSELVGNQSPLVIHGRTTSLEFGCLKYTLEVRRYNADADYRNKLASYKQMHTIQDDDYPLNLLATPADSSLVTKDYVFKNLVGAGTFSVVYGAYGRRTGDAVAIKRITRTQKTVEAIDHEIWISKRIGKHPRFCHLMEVIDPAAEGPSRGYQKFGLDEVFMVYAPLASWTIDAMIRENIDLDTQTKEKISWQLLEGIEYLHSIGIMHRDIKPLNMIVVSMNPDHPEARLIDFGWAKMGLYSGDFNAGTLSYVAPEILKGMEDDTSGCYDEKVDIFAFGLSMYQFFCRQRCDWDRIAEYAGGSLSESTLDDLRYQLHISRNPINLKTWLDLPLIWDPDNRPSAEQLLKLRPSSQNHEDSSEHNAGYDDEAGNGPEGRRENNGWHDDKAGDSPEKKQSSMERVPMSNSVEMLPLEVLGGEKSQGACQLIESASLDQTPELKSDRLTTAENGW